MLQTQRIVITGVLIAVFFLLFLQCMNFIQAPEMARPIFESFTSAGPTRPGDCLCLPGYVPSNTKSGQRMSGLVIQKETEQGKLYFFPFGSRIAYWIPACTMQGITHNFCTDPMKRTLTVKEWSSMLDSFDKTLTTSVWNDIHKTTTTPTFFCQKLTDASDTKACTVLSK